MKIRLATPQDASELLEIYAPYVEHTCITFEYDVPSVEEFASRIRHTLEDYPYVVAEEDGKILGYAYASAFKSRAAYAWSAETSIYVGTEHHRNGIGKALYSALENYLRRQNICSLCACISYPNPVSIAFHESFGYHTVAHFPASGFKSGAWWDMIWMEKELCLHTVPPKPFLPFHRL